MKKRGKDELRREFIKLKLNDYNYEECQIILDELYNSLFSIRTLKRWYKRFNLGDWNLRDTSTRPYHIFYTYTQEDIGEVIALREKSGYSSYQIKQKGISMSESLIKHIIKDVGLSRGNKMEGIKLKWIRFERDTPNSMWQIDGTQRSDGLWEVPIEDDCSRYCLAIGLFEHNNTENMIKLLEMAIEMHGKPREILTDNGCEFGGNGKGDNEFDAWCDKQGIAHIRSRIHKPTTVGKVSALQQTMQRELSYCNNDYEHFRWRYNTDRPHRSLHGLTPYQIYFGYKRHKKYKEGVK